MRVRIVVDGNGSVIRATIAPGTNIADPSVRAAALEAARKTRFNAVPALTSKKVASPTTSRSEPKAD